MSQPECIQEIVGSLPDDLSGKHAYFGFEPSGRLHKGILNPIAALKWCMDRGARGTVLVADVHAKLNEKVVHSWDSIDPHLPTDVNVVLQSHVVNMHWFEELLLISQNVNVKRVARSIDCAGRQANDTLDGVRMSALNYALLQCVDMHRLDIDIAIGGMDQRKVHMLARDVFPDIGWKVPTAIHTKIMLDSKGNKMSKSHPETCEWL